MTDCPRIKNEWQRSKLIIIDIRLTKIIKGMNDNKRNIEYILLV
jgi:hypothetical protein